MKFKKFLYFSIAFACLGIDITLKINYSLFTLNCFIGKYLLYDEIKLREISLVEYFFGIVVFPIVVGTIFKYLHL